MMKYRSIWDDINKLKPNDKKIYETKLVHDDFIKIYLAVDYLNNKSIIIDPNERFNFKDKIESYIGLEIYEELLIVNKTDKRKCIIIKNLYKEFDFIFESVCENIIDNLIMDKNIEKTLRTTLKRWEIFFKKDRIEGLTVKEQRGLYGELWMLKLAINNLDPKVALESWKGYENSSYDFHFKSVLLDMKTTSSKSNFKIHISNEKQLDNHGISDLMIGLLVVNETYNNGEKLENIVNELIDIFKAHDGILDIEFKNMLLEYGYSDINSHLYKKRYIQKDFVVYKIEDDFPKITQKDIPDGIEEVKYSVNLNSCDRFKIELSELLDKLK